jgi:hypothetical protein
MPYVLLSINKNDWDAIRQHLKGAYQKQDVEYFIEGVAEDFKAEALIFKERISQGDYHILQSILAQSLKWEK